MIAFIYFVPDMGIRNNGDTNKARVTHNHRSFI